MSRGGHYFRSFWLSKKKKGYFPVYLKETTLPANTAPYIADSGEPDSDKSRDPVLINKILAPKENSIEQGRNIKTALCQTGAGEVVDDSSSSCDTDPEDNFVETKTLETVDPHEDSTLAEPSTSTEVEPEIKAKAETEVTPEPSDLSQKKEDFFLWVEPPAKRVKKGSFLIE